MSREQYEALTRNPANHVPLSPLSFLRRTVDLFPSRTALIYGARRQSWADTGERARRLASALVQRGIRAGDTVSVVAANTPELFEAHFGIPMAGAVLNTINVRLDPGTIAYILEHSDARMLITDTRFAPTVREALRQLGRKLPVIDIIDDNEPPGERLGDVDYEGLLAEGDPLSPWRLPEDEWQALALNYTSGTSGRPKGVVYHHRGGYLMSMGTVAAWNLPLHPTYLYTVPMFHCNGWGHAWTMTLMAGTVVCCRTVTARAIFEAIAEHRVTHFGGAPIVLGMLVNAPESDRRSVDHPVRVLTAGAPPPAAILERMKALGFDVMQVYGLTETFGHVTQCLWREEWDALPFERQAEIQSWQGVTFPMNEAVRIVDLETRQPVPRDGITQGEIELRGNTVMKGYYKDPEATAQAFTDGWLRTGDAAVWHEHGYMQIRDRLKDVIISGGENVSSVEIEDALYKHPAVAAAAVVAQPDDKWGEVPCAFVELKDGQHATAPELIAFCRTRLAGFKSPKTIVFGELPKTSTGKIQKYVLRARAAETGASG